MACCCTSLTGRWESLLPAPQVNLRGMLKFKKAQAVPLEEVRCAVLLCVHALHCRAS